MGCASSKSVEKSVTVDSIYRPPPASIALFDINTIDEPWLIAAAAAKDQDESKKPTSNNPVVPLPLLEKLESYDVAPKSWSEVSKALQDHLNNPKTALEDDSNVPIKNSPPPPPKINPIQTFDELKKPPPPELAGSRPVSSNSFILRDKQQQSNGINNAVKWRRRDPFESYPEKCPPGNGEGVVLYTTTLRGVRRTFDDCEKARQIVEAYAVEGGVAVDERDVSLHGEYLKEVRELVGEGDATVPRLFVKGRYLGGVDEVLELGETGRLREMMRWVRREGGGGEGRRGCEGCGGVRFVPCLECSGSCKVVVMVEKEGEGEEVERCGKCNENGLMMCPVCH
ncbi:uncharacterized protein [Typha latifolia]|uniref:uncharacterized protein n=1 Tax=Typha latifolia TaxID=4733 RepID=UPI003C2AC5D7